jgi:hypothetical protein
VWDEYVLRIGSVNLQHEGIHISIQGVCGKSVKYVGSRNGVHDMMRAKESRPVHWSENKTNSAKKIIGTTRDTITVCPRTLIWAYQSQPAWWDSVALSFQKERHWCVSGDTQTLDFEGTGRDGIEIILFL